jgi:branched-chain amino acid transport system permease protein
MLALARGLAAKPMILLLDEPSLGLAPTLIDTLFRALADLRDAGTTILLVDQMVDFALSVADRGYVLKNGRIVHAGPAMALQNDPALERAYLGGDGSA